MAFRLCQLNSQILIRSSSRRASCNSSAVGYAGVVKGGKWLRLAYRIVRSSDDHQEQSQSFQEVDHNCTRRVIAFVKTMTVIYY